MGNHEKSLFASRLGVSSGAEGTGDRILLFL